MPINTTTSRGFIDDKDDDIGDVGDVGDDGDDDDESSGMTCRADTINLLASTLTITPLPKSYEQRYD